MREVPRPSTAATILAFFLAFVGGAALGGWMAELFAQGSWVAAAVSFFLFPLCMIIGLQAWLGLALLLTIPRFVIRLLRGRVERLQRGTEAQLVPPGTNAFVAVASPLSLITGLVVGFFSTAGFFVAVLAYWGIGTVYGLALKALADRGYLFVPESF